MPASAPSTGANVAAAVVASCWGGLRRRRRLRDAGVAAPPAAAAPCTKSRMVSGAGGARPAARPSPAAVGGAAAARWPCAAAASCCGLRRLGRLRSRRSRAWVRGLLRLELRFLRRLRLGLVRFLGSGARRGPSRRRVFDFACCGGLRFGLAAAAGGGGWWLGLGRRRRGGGGCGGGRRVGWAAGWRRGTGRCAACSTGGRLGLLDGRPRSRRPREVGPVDRRHPDQRQRRRRMQQGGQQRRPSATYGRSVVGGADGVGHGTVLCAPVRGRWRLRRH